MKEKISSNRCQGCYSILEIEEMSMGTQYKWMPDTIYYSCYCGRYGCPRYLVRMPLNSFSPSLSVDETFNKLNDSAKVILDRIIAK